MPGGNYMVSVRLMTYNHEKYIREAMDSVFAQQTNFPFEVVVGDDFSTDRNMELIRSYKSTERITVRILERQRGDAYDLMRKEKGRLYNFGNIVENCTGKYIALLDGDDYWIDPLKLQKQVDFMEAHPGCSISFHRAYSLIGGERKPHPVPESPTGFYTFEDLFGPFNFLTTASVMYRNDFKKMPDWFYELPYGDMGLYYMLLQRGTMACLPEFMSIYRVHTGGIWSGRKKWDLYSDEFRFYEILYPMLKGDQNKIIDGKAEAVLEKMAKLKYPRFGLARLGYVKYNMAKLRSLRNKTAPAAQLN